MTQREIIRNNLNKADWEITKDKCDSTHPHRQHLAANGKHKNKRKIYCTNVHLRIIEILITLMYNLSAVTAAVTARNLRGEIRGRRGLWPFWAKRPKFTQKWSLEKSYLRITRERSLGLLHGCKPKPCFPFATRVDVQSLMETCLTPQSLKHTIYGEKCIYRRYWHVIISFGP